jgi:hypothetical protein
MSCSDVAARLSDSGKVTVIRGNMAVVPDWAEIRQEVAVAVRRLDLSL